MNGWMDGWTDGRLDGCVDGWTDEWLDERTDERMNGWLTGWMDGWTGRWMDSINDLLLIIPHFVPNNTFNKISVLTEPCMVRKIKKKTILLLNENCL